jgi:hypothetical protein
MQLLVAPYSHLSPAYGFPSTTALVQLQLSSPAPPPEEEEEGAGTHFPPFSHDFEHGTSQCSPMNSVPRQSQLGPRADDEEVEVEVAASDGSLAVGSMHFPSLHPPQSASSTRLRDVGFRESGGMERMDVIAYLLLLFEEAAARVFCVLCFLLLLL